MTYRLTRTLMRSLNTTGILLLSFIMLIPFLLMILTSFKTMGEIYSPTFVFIPESISFSNYIEAMNRGDWITYLLNTVYVTVITVVASIILNSTAGYAFARLNFKGGDTLFKISLIGLMMPAQVTMVPVFIILKHFPLAGGNNIFGMGGFGFINTYTGLILPYIAGSFGVFLFRQFYLNFPRDLDEAAKLDGLNAFQIYTKIYMPLSKPIIATLVVLKSTSTWNEYIWPLIITNTDKMKTVQLALSVYRAEEQVDWNLLMAATTVIVLPLVVLFLALQRYFVEGIVTTGLK